MDERLVYLDPVYEEQLDKEIEWPEEQKTDAEVQQDIDEWDGGGVEK